MHSIINKLAFPAPNCSYNLTLSYLTFISSDNYKIPIRLYVVDEKLPTILLCHANSEDIGMTNPKQLSEQFNANICLFDYAGYGMHSCKKSSEDACKKDVLHVYYYLINQGLTNLVIYGRSIGTGVAIYLAYHTQKHKLILVSAFKSVCRTMIDIYQPWDILESYTLAHKIPNETLFIHGCRDNVTPYNAAKELACEFEDASFVTIHGASHHYIYQYPQYIEAIKKFIH
jgi:pimeloyl-ACP methyl ester carboxylesterase